ncbi:hypothetical protein BGHDH14_bgh02751 [Blumeria hordei DH14]|uniref:Zn(2)-C6 fungal-type domain-containing protein n=1 Tax=Blumeria graminis f. sp. hordei (strain DH14) TaxID=546991 RepID=N1JH97_BLUG1|nr:hypothetical protein BGHDH14_bgh02751 [Blumeria hordei DH14]
MGRKPNAFTALIIQYFERGAKLPDSSNRYQHTCKACGEKFPKGRIDSLTAHLVKKCPALSIQDRQNALLQLNDFPNIEKPPNVSHNISTKQSPNVEFPLVSSSWTALETLAEVSRQFDMSEKHDDRSMNTQSLSTGTKISELQAPRKLEVYEQYTLDNPPVSYEQRPNREKKASNKKTHNQVNDVSLLSPGHISVDNISHGASSLTMNLNSVNDAVAASRFMPSMVDPQLLGHHINEQTSIHTGNPSDTNHVFTQLKTVEQALNEAGTSFSESLFNQGRGEQQLTWPIVDGSEVEACLNVQNFGDSVESSETTRAIMYSRLAMTTPLMNNEYTAEYRNGQKQNRPKVRGRFSASRRKEVQEVRKRGACIRCRMLKKPCSEGTPCNTCKNVESARLWKTPCIRTRVADELEMYTAGLHAVLAYHEVNNAKGQIDFRPSNCQIYASHYPETAIFASFNSLEGHSISSIAGHIDPSLNQSLCTNTLHILDHDKDDITSKLEVYAKKMSSVFFKSEPSKFMHTTLNFALELAVSKQDHLLLRALELWSFVHILMDHEMTWKLRQNNENEGQLGKQTAIEQITIEGTQSLICSQLNAAAEKKAAILCKSVLNELERRLLQRTAADSFETFLVVIVTLSCIEKSTWLFQSWEQDSFKYRWPLAKSPNSISSQGEKLADMLQMLLRMRNVPPKTYTRPEDGILASDASPLAQEYYKKLNLSYVHVLGKQANHTFDSADSRCFELRYCSRLLLPIT